MRGTAWTVSAAAVAWAGLAAVAGEKALLTEGSMWKNSITWMKVVVKTEAGVKPARIHGGLTEESDPPSPDWIRPDFDDSSWACWRRPYQAQNLRLKDDRKGKIPSADGEDTGVMLYEPGQYGYRVASYVGLHCLRGRFFVEDAGKAGPLKLAVEFRGGLAAYMNGKEAGRAYLPADGKLEPGTLADSYPADAFTGEIRTDGPGWIAGCIPCVPDMLKRFNQRIRRVDLEIPRAMLQNGVNVVALEIHRAPSNPPDKETTDRTWNQCELVSVRLTGDGAVRPSVERPKGLQVWNANALTRISPFGYSYGGRVYQGTGVYFQRFPLSWGDPNTPMAPIRLVGARNGVFTGQVGVGCDQPIRGLKATMSELTRKGGSERISASNISVLYMTFPDEPYLNVDAPSVSWIDVLAEAAPPEVPSRPAGETSPWYAGGIRSAGVTTVIDTGAALAVWVKVRVPRDAACGEYEGALTVGAAGHAPVSVPVRLQVVDWTIPAPGEWVGHVGTPHSPDTLAIWYKAALWSEEHWKLVEKTLSYMGELGCKAVFLPLRARTCWFNNEQSLVYWAKDAGGGFRYDFRVFDRYLDLVQRYLKPEVYCLYAVDFSGKGPTAQYSVLDPGTGKVEEATGPAYEPSPEAMAFWKPVIAEATDRLKKLGAKPDQIMLGLAWEGMGGLDPKSQKGNPKTELFRQVIPEGMRLAQLAHTGGGKSEIPYGYAMSVWGNRGTSKSKRYGSRDLPLILVKHYRAEGSIDLRPTAHRGPLRIAQESAMLGTTGIGPLGMDFWQLPADPQRKRRAGTLEGAGASNLSMGVFSTSALLAPGATGPVSTARFEMFREGLQEVEARRIVAWALFDADTSKRLGPDLVKRCEDMLKERDRARSFAEFGGWSQGEGWNWFEGSGWEERAGKLFACAGEVTRALRK